MADLTTKEIKFVSPEKLGYYDQKIKEFIDKKDAALQLNIDAANAAIQAEKERAEAKELENANAAQAAQDAADAAQAHSEALAEKVGEVAEGKTVMGIVADNDTAVRELISGLDESKADKDQVATDIADAVKAEEDARKEAVAGVQGAVDALAGTHATDKKALEDAIALKADKATIEATVATLEEKVDANEEDIEKKMTDLTARVAANETAVGTTLPNAIDAVDAKVDVLVGEDTGKSARTIANEELAKQLVAEGAKESLDTLAEIAAWIQAHPDDASAMNKAIEDLEALVGTLPEGVTATTVVGLVQELVSAEKSRAEGVEGGLDERLQALEGKFTGEESVDAKIAKAKEEAVTEAKGHADDLNDAMNERVEALEAIDHTHANAEVLDGITAEKVAAWDAAEQNAKDYADTEIAGLANGAVKENTEAIAELGEVVETKANASDVTTLAGKVTTAEGEIDTLQSEMDAVEAAVATKAESSTVADLDAAYKAADTALDSRIAELEAIKHVEISTEDIDAMFAEVTE